MGIDTLSISIYVHDSCAISEGFFSSPLTDEKALSKQEVDPSREQAPGEETQML